MKKRALKTTVALVLAVVMLLALCSCSFLDKIIKFTVNFTVEGGEYATVRSEGKTVQLPTDPVKSGYTFDGWYYDEGVWERELDPANIDANMKNPTVTVYAKFVSAQTGDSSSNGAGGSSGNGNTNTPGNSGGDDDSGPPSSEDIEVDGWLDTPGGSGNSSGSSGGGTATTPDDTTTDNGGTTTTPDDTTTDDDNTGSGSSGDSGSGNGNTGSGSQGGSDDFDDVDSDGWIEYGD